MCRKFWKVQRDPSCTFLAVVLRCEQAAGQEKLWGLPIQYTRNLCMPRYLQSSAYHSNLSSIRCIYETLSSYNLWTCRVKILARTYGSFEFCEWNRLKALLPKGEIILESQKVLFVLVTLPTLFWVDCRYELVDAPSRHAVCSCVWCLCCWIKCIQPHASGHAYALSNVIGCPYMRRRNPLSSFVYSCACATRSCCIVLLLRALLYFCMLIVSADFYLLLLCFVLTLIKQVIHTLTE